MGSRFLIVRWAADFPLTAGSSFAPFPSAALFHQIKKFLLPWTSAIGRFIETADAFGMIGGKDQSPEAVGIDSAPYRSNEDSVRKKSAGVAIRSPVRFATPRVKCLVL